MPRPSPYQFRNADEIIKYLRKKEAEIQSWFNKRIESLDEIAVTGIGSNTFRAFHHMPIQPSVVFTEWALSEFRSKTIVNNLLNVESQTEYDEWSDQFSQRLRKIWESKMGERMPYGPSRKLPDLLLKLFPLWSGLSSSQRKRIIGYLHVPLDSFTLIGISNCINDPEIPETATMKFVVGKTMYYQIQQTIRNITDMAKVPSIFFDVLAWNMPIRSK